MYWIGRLERVAKTGLEPVTSCFTMQDVLPSELLCQIPARFSAKTTIQSEVLPDGVFRSLLERLPLSPDGRFVVVTVGGAGFSGEQI